MKRSREPEQDINPASPGSPGADMSPSGPQHTAKYTELDPVVVDSDNDSNSSFPTVHILCSLPPHPEMAFNSYTAYETHYSSLHTNRCLECRKNFPSEYLLGIHIEEIHDPIVRVRRDQGAHTVCSTPRPHRLYPTTQGPNRDMNSSPASSMDATENA